MNLTAFNDALLLKHLYKFFNRQNLPWVPLIWHSYYAGLVPHALGNRGSFWWRDIMKLEGKFRDFAKAILGDGRSVRFWEDDWGHGVLASRFSRCYSFFKGRNLTVKDVVDLIQIISSRFFICQFLSKLLMSYERCRVSFMPLTWMHRFLTPGDAPGGVLPFLPEILCFLF